MTCLVHLKSQISWLSVGDLIKSTLSLILSQLKEVEQKKKKNLTRNADATFSFHIYKFRFRRYITLLCVCHIVIGPQNVWCQ